MSTNIVYSSESQRDLDRIWEWIAIEHEEPAAADRTIKAILDRIDRAAIFPLAAPLLSSICQTRSDRRFVESKGYIVFFRFSNETLFVDRILSGKSDYLQKLFNVDSGTEYYFSPN